MVKSVLGKWQIRVAKQASVTSLNRAAQANIWSAGYQQGGQGHGIQLAMECCRPSIRGTTTAIRNGDPVMGHLGTDD